VIFVFATSQVQGNPSGLIDTGVFLSVVQELAKRPGVYLNTIHQMILPVAAALTVASNHPLGEHKSLLSYLFLLPLATIFICILDGLVFNVRSILGDVDKGLVTQLFINSASNLSMYVMILVGLRLRGDQQ
jgi:hypothetical protein